jgi:hypothetical protein
MNTKESEGTLQGALLPEESEAFGYGCANMNPEQMQEQLNVAKQLQDQE